LTRPAGLKRIALPYGRRAPELQQGGDRARRNMPK
jgi:hypothetical protein